jgi:hypothetical protein
MTRVNPIGRACIVLAAAAVATQGVSALEPIAVLTPSDVPPPYTNGFGLSVALSGDYIAVGAPWDPYYNAQQTGAVYVFRRQGRAWIEQTKLTVLSEMWDGFGGNVAMDGDVLVGCAPQFDQECVDCHGPGAVYVFRRDHHGTPDDPTDDTWGQEAKLDPPVPREGDVFGFSVAIDASVIVVGQYGSRKAEVFRWTPGPPGGWGHEATLMGDTPGEGLGWSVDIDGDRIIVGSPDYDERRGRATVFVHDGTQWILDGYLQGDDPAPIDDFGRFVSISGESAVVGVPNDDDAGTNAGAAYVFMRESAGTWVQATRFGVGDTTALEHLGASVSIDRDLVAVGKVANRMALLYRRQDDTWMQVDSFLGGLDVALDGKFAIRGTGVYVVREQRSLCDFAGFQNCFSGMPTVKLPPECQPFDLKADGHVDLGDFAEFVGTFVGPEQ